MVDLKSSNLKLKQRARNILRALAPSAVALSDEELDAAIKSCNGNVKLALMHLMSGLDVIESIQRLQQSEGVLKRALSAWQTEQAALTPHPSISTQKTPSENDSIDLILCVDGGGSKCAIAVADTYGLIGKSTGPACNFTDSSLPQIENVISTTAANAISNYLSTTGIDAAKTPINITKVRAGLSGFDRPGARESVKPMLAGALGLPSDEGVEVMADTDLLASVLGKHPDCRGGVVLIAGTGSVAMGFNREDANGRFTRTGRAGGWGHILGDEGSGFDIGRSAVRLALKAVERRRLSRNNGEAMPLSSFHVAVIKKLGIEDTRDADFDLLSKVLRSDDGSVYDLKARLSSVAATVLEHMSTDEQAASIVSKTTDALVELVETLLLAGKDAGDLLVLAGGVMKSRAYRSHLLEKLDRAGLAFAGVDIVEDPATAAVLAMTMNA